MWQFRNPYHYPVKMYLLFIKSILEDDSKGEEKEFAHEYKCNIKIKGLPWEMFVLFIITGIVAFYVYSVIKIYPYMSYGDTERVAGIIYILAGGIISTAILSASLADVVFMIKWGNLDITVSEETI